MGDHEESSKRNRGRNTHMHFGGDVVSLLTNASSALVNTLLLLLLSESNGEAAKNSRLQLDTCATSVPRTPRQDRVRGVPILERGINRETDP